MFTHFTFIDGNNIDLLVTDFISLYFDPVSHLSMKSILDLLATHSALPSTRLHCSSLVRVETSERRQDRQSIHYTMWQWQFFVVGVFNLCPSPSPTFWQFLTLLMWLILKKSYDSLVFSRAYKIIIHSWLYPLGVVLDSLWWRYCGMINLTFQFHAPDETFCFTYLGYAPFNPRSRI